MYRHSLLLSDAKDVEMAANFVRVGDGNLNIALLLLTDSGSQIDKATKIKVLYGGCAWGRLDVVKRIVEEHNLDPNSESFQNCQNCVYIHAVEPPYVPRCACASGAYGSMFVFLSSVAQGSMKCK